MRRQFEPSIDSSFFRIQFVVSGLVKAKTAQVMWEGRNVKVASGSITDKWPISGYTNIRLLHGTAVVFEASGSR